MMIFQNQIFPDRKGADRSYMEPVFRNISQSGINDGAGSLIRYILAAQRYRSFCYLTQTAYSLSELFLPIA